MQTNVTKNRHLSPNSSYRYWRDGQILPMGSYEREIAPHPHDNRTLLQRLFGGRK